MRILRRVGILAAAGGLMLALGNAGWSQGTGTGTGSGGGNGSATQGGHVPTGVPSSSLPNGPDVDLPPQITQEQSKMRNADRQKQLVEDTEKLLALANELKVDVDKSNKDTLSLDVVKKADEIEKLAHSVKEKMKNAT